MLVPEEGTRLRTRVISLDDENRRLARGQGGSDRGCHVWLMPIIFTENLPSNPQLNNHETQVKMLTLAGPDGAPRPLGWRTPGHYSSLASSAQKSFQWPDVHCSVSLQVGKLRLSEQRLTEEARGSFIPPHAPRPFPPRLMSPSPPSRQMGEALRGRADHRAGLPRGPGHHRQGAHDEPPGHV